MPEPVHTTPAPGTLHSILQCYAEADPASLEARLAELEREWDLDRALEAHTALAGLLGMLLTTTRGVAWSWLPVTVFGLLLQQALQGWSPPVPLLRRLGFRSREEIDQEMVGLKLLRGDFRDVLASTVPRERAERAFEVLGGERATEQKPSSPSWRKKYRAVRTGAGNDRVRAGTIIAGDIHAENFIEHVKSKWPAEDEQLEKALRSIWRT